MPSRHWMGRSCASLAPRCRRCPLPRRSSMRLCRRPTRSWRNFARWRLTSLPQGARMPIEVKMPQLGESVTEGTIGRWLKQPGEQVARFEPLLEVTTDKVDTEITSTVDGTISELLVPEGETVR